MNWKKKDAYWVIITVWRAHRGYASFNFTLYSPFPPVCSVSSSLTGSLSPFSHSHLSSEAMLTVEA